MTAERVVIELKNKMVTLVVAPFDGDVDVDSILKIDYSNLLGEILTFPVLFNRIANMRAELTNIVAQAKLRCDIEEAKLYKKHKDKLISDGERGSDKATEAAVLRDPLYKTEKKIYFSKQKDFDYIDALYWSAQSKDRKLNVLSEKITPEEFEKDLLEGTINGIMIKMSKKLMK